MTDLEKIELVFRRIQDDPHPPRDPMELVDMVVGILTEMNNTPAFIKGRDGQ